MVQLVARLIYMNADYCCCIAGQFVLQSCLSVFQALSGQSILVHQSLSGESILVHWRC